MLRCSDNRQGHNRIANGKRVKSNIMNFENAAVGTHFDIRQLMYEQTRKRYEKGAEANTGKNYLEYREALTLIRDVMNNNHTSELAAILEDSSAANYI